VARGDTHDLEFGPRIGCCYCNPVPPDQHGGVDLHSCLEQDDFSSNHHPALLICGSMIFSENRYPLFGIML
jgi:hypothetical protein